MYDNMYPNTYPYLRSFFQRVGTQLPPLPPNIGHYLGNATVLSLLITLHSCQLGQSVQAKGFTEIKRIEQMEQTIVKHRLTQGFPLNTLLDLSQMHLHPQIIGNKKTFQSCRCPQSTKIRCKERLQAHCQDKFTGRSRHGNRITSISNLCISESLYTLLPFRPTLQGAMQHGVTVNQLPYQRPILLGVRQYRVTVLPNQKPILRGAQQYRVTLLLSIPILPGARQYRGNSISISNNNSNTISNKKCVGNVCVNNNVGNNSVPSEYGISSRFNSHLTSLAINLIFATVLPKSCLS